MNLNRKLIIPFAIVILVLVIAVAGWIISSQGEQARQEASNKLASALSRLNSDFGKIQLTNRDFALKLARDPSLIESFSTGDRAAISSSFKTASDLRSFSGTLTAYDQSGRIIYSDDTPAKFGYSLRGKNSAVDYVLNNQENFIGLTHGLSIGQAISLAAMFPVRDSSGHCVGIVAVSEPINEEFLTGEATKFSLLNEPLTGIDLVLVPVQNSGSIYCTPALLRERPAYLHTLSEQGIKALPNWHGGAIGDNGHSLFDIFKKNTSIPELSAGFSKDGRFWQSYSLLSLSSSGTARGLGPSNKNMEVIGVILASTPLLSSGVSAKQALTSTVAMGIIAFLALFFFAGRLNYVSVPAGGSLEALVDRVKRWKTDKRMPPGKRLVGDYAELSQLIDETLIEWQNLIQKLKSQLGKNAPESGQEKAEKQVQITDAQFDVLNRQLANQNRQLSEFSRQLNHANQQAVFLQHELQAILQNTTEGILILDQFGNIIHANNIFLNWFGTTEGGIAGRFCLDLIKKSDNISSNRSGDTLAARPFVKHEANANTLVENFVPEGIIYNAQTGKVAEVTMNLQPVISYDNRVNGYILIARDKSLRSEITSLKMEIVKILARAIRAPLLAADKEWQNVISAYPEILQENIAENAGQGSGIAEPLHAQLNRELNQALTPAPITIGDKLAALRSRYNTLISSVENMLATHGQSIEHLIPLAGEKTDINVLDLQNTWSPIEPTKETFALPKLMSECLQQVANLAREKQLRLEYKTSTALPNIVLDRALTGSIIVPVIEKMISITTSGGKVHVETSTDGKAIQLSVSSSGPALSEIETADMFAGFNPDKHTEDTYGSRLALYLARNNAERIGAKLWAQSETIKEDENKETTIQGTVIYLVFPTLNKS